MEQYIIPEKEINTLRDSILEALDIANNLSFYASLDPGLIIELLGDSLVILDGLNKHTQMEDI